MIRGRKVKERTGAGARLYALRMHLNLSGAQASERWGISVECINRYELGRELIKSDRAVRIAQMEGVSLDWLFALSDEGAPV